MKFYDEILKWKNNGYSTINSKGNEFICHVHKDIKDDYLHILFYPLDKKKQKEIIKEYNIKENNGLKEYFKFIFEHNGAVLYSGAIVFFGYTDNIIPNVFLEPSSLNKMNELDRFVADNPVYLYIGNLMHRDYDNVNIYINKKTGYILWLHKNEIFKEFESLDEMLNHIIEYYDNKYGLNGENLNYKNKSKNVYENVQLY